MWRLILILAFNGEFAPALWTDNLIIVCQWRTVFARFKICINPKVIGIRKVDKFIA